MFTRSLVALAALATLSLPVTALASDSSGTKGHIQLIEVNHSTGDTYLQFHGRIVVKSGDTTTEYKWGGTACTNNTLPAEFVRLLWDAFSNRKSTNVTPKYQAGQGNNKCLVGAAFENRKQSGGDEPS